MTPKKEVKRSIDNFLKQARGRRTPKVKIVAQII